MQQNPGSVVLNRVTGFERSLIDGLLKSNGQVFLINAQGITIGKNGLVDTAGFLGTTLDLPNQSFLEGSFHFQGASKAAIVNQGTVKARGEDVTFIAFRVQNEGEVSAPNGSFNVGGGFDVYFQPDAKEKIYIKSKLKKIEGEEGYTNTGIIKAIDHQIAVDGNLYARAINLSGSVDSMPGLQDQGLILAVAENGKIVVSGDLKTHGIQGGEICLLGDEIKLKGATLDVSSDAGEGLIQIGTSETDHKKAASVFIDKDSKLLADCHKKGDGGQILVFGEKEVTFQGATSFKEGKIEGSGGVFELASLSMPVFEGSILSPSPTQKVILSSQEMHPTSQAIETILKSANLHLDTRSNTTSFSQRGNIYIESPLQLDGFNHHLTMTSSDSIYLKESLAFKSLTLRALSDIVIDKDLIIVDNCDLFAKSIQFSNLDRHPRLESKKGSIRVETDLLKINSKGAFIIAERDISFDAKHMGAKIAIAPQGKEEVLISSFSGSVKLGSNRPFENIDIDAGQSYIAIEADRDIEICAQDILHFQSGDQNFAQVMVHHREGSSKGDIKLNFKKMQMISKGADVGIENAASGSIYANGSHMLLDGQKESSFMVAEAGSIHLNGSLECLGGAYIETKGKGTTISQIDGDVILKSTKDGASSLRAKGHKSDINLSGSGAILVEADHSDSYIEAQFGDIKINKTGNLEVIATNSDAYIQAKNGSVECSSKEDIRVKGIGDNASIIGFSGATFTAQHVSLEGGESYERNSESYIKTQGDLSGLSITADAIRLKGGSGEFASAYLKTSGDKSPITIKGHLQVLGGIGQEAAAEIVTEGQSDISIFSKEGVDLHGGVGSLSYAAIEGLGGGNLVIRIDKDLSFLGGDSTSYASSFISMNGAVDIESKGIVELRGGSGSGNTSAFINTTEMNNPITIKAKEVNLKGGDGAVSSAYITADDRQSHISIIAGANLAGGTGAKSSAEIIARIDSNITVDATELTQQITMMSGTGGSSSATICNAGDVGNISMMSGGKFWVASSGSSESTSAQINSVEDLKIGSTTGDVVIENENKKSSISAGKSMLVSAEKGDVYLKKEARLDLINPSSGTLTVKAANNIYLQQNSVIETRGSKIILMTDQMHPGHLKFGSGGLHSDPGTLIASHGGELRIYTPTFNNNSILGVLNGERFKGQVGKHDGQNREFAMFPGGGYSGPFAVYYKNSPMKIDEGFISITELASLFFFQMFEDPHTRSIRLMKEKDLPNKEKDTRI
jgi:filamentous hemagglutinin family protein